MNNHKMKLSHLDKQHELNKRMFEKPYLNQLFFELTLRCNEHCWHCGSRCGDVCSEEMAPEEWMSILDQVREDFGNNLPQINVTGGEPLLYPDFEKVMSYAHSLGFGWGMTSNATLITPEVARMLTRCGMSTISVSIDGLEETHDKYRGKKNAYKDAMTGIQNLINEGSFRSIMVTTVVNHENMKELEALYEIMCGIDIDSWRVIGVEPIGRALDHPELEMTPEDQKNLLEFIRKKRAENMPVTYGCSHYLGLDYEREVRDWYYICMAGVMVASITSKGEVTACLDIDRNQPGIIQGNIHERRFSDIWKNEFGIYRRDKSAYDEKCRTCESRKYCMGGACHSWDYVGNTQRVCIINDLKKSYHTSV